MRGKDAMVILQFLAHLGSPPLARERRLRFFNQKIWAGITPACAGKTPNLIEVFSANEDHPRLRGKDFEKVSDIEKDIGSPPLTRERRLANIYAGLAFRITPACAGKTEFRRVDKGKLWDHPRLRGKTLRQVAHE